MKIDISAVINRELLAGLERRFDEEIIYGHSIGRPEGITFTQTN